MRDFGTKPVDAAGSYIKCHNAMKNAINALHWVLHPGKHHPDTVAPKCDWTWHMRQAYKKTVTERQEPFLELFHKATLRNGFNTMFAPILQSLKAVNCSRGFMTMIDMALNINNQIAAPYATDQMRDVVWGMLADTIENIRETSGVIAAIDIVIGVNDATTSLQWPPIELPVLVISLVNHIDPDSVTGAREMFEIYVRYALKHVSPQIGANVEFTGNNDVVTCAFNIKLEQMRKSEEQSEHLDDLLYSEHLDDLLLH